MVDMPLLHKDQHKQVVLHMIIYSLASFQDHFLPHRENGLVNSLFQSRSICRNVGRPIRLCCIRDVLHGNNSNQEG